MSSSVFKEYSSQHSEVDSTTLKSNSNLVVFINKNGSVSVDHSALQELLVNDATATNTSVSVIRVCSPTPSLEMELNEQEELENEIRNAELGLNDEDDEASNNLDEEDDETDENDDDEDGEDKSDGDADSKPTKSRKSKKTPQQKIPNVSLMVENYFNPEEAKQLASDILSIAGISNPLQISVDYEFKRYVVANDHCYTPYTSPSQRSHTDEDIVDVRTPATITRLKPPSIDKSSTGISTPLKSSRKAAAANSTEKPVELSDGEEVPSEQSEGEQYTDDSDQTYNSPSESDRDSDLDFSVKERSAKAKKLLKNRSPAKASKPKLVKGLVPKKRQSVGGDNANPPATEDPAKKKPIKAFTKTNRLASNITATSTPLTKNVSDNIKIPSTTSITLVDSVAANPTSTFPKIVSVSIKPKIQGPLKIPSTIKLVHQRPPTTVPTPNVTATVLPKHVKKPMANSESALFSDMTSLFSTPDLIRKVNDTPNSSNRVTNISVINLPPVTLTPIPLNSSNTTNSNQSKTIFMSLTPTSSRPRPTPTVTTSIRNTVKLPNNALPNMIFSNVIQRPANPQLPTVTFQSNMPSQAIHCQPPLNNIIHSISIPSSSNQNTMTFSPLLNDVDLLDGLANVEDVLSEDLMQHVAKLVEDKNLQQVIDQQVLGVRPVTILPKTTPISLPPPPVTTTTIDPESTTSLPTTPIAVVATKPKPEPIKIVRSDGRVITLPPIEAPTTRGAKRRAQNQDPSSATSSPSSTQITIDETTPKSHSRRPSLVPERRSSVAISRKSMTPKIKSIATPSPAGNSVGVSTGFDPNEVIELDDDEEEDGSDGSYNSEDDPYRLWCICRTPHNNRFMICCDKCEDWFHGKCVNVTKALGVEMEERGVEWVCPNCIKKHPHLQQRQMAVLGKKIISRKASNSSLVQELSATATALDQSLQSCIVCKKSARQNSIYCSDDCIRLHAQTTQPPQQLTLSKTPATSTTPSTPNAPLIVANTQSKVVVNSTSNKNLRIEVFERTTGRFLTGNSAPTADNLKRWLQEHPTFEVVNAGSAQAIAIKAKKQQLQQLSRSMAQEEQKQQLISSQQVKPIQTTLKIGPTKNIQIVNPQTQSATPTQSHSTKQNPLRIQKMLPSFLSPTPSPVTNKTSQPVVVSVSKSANTILATTTPTKQSPIMQISKSVSSPLTTNTFTKPSPVLQTSKSVNSPLAVSTTKPIPVLQSSKSVPLASTTTKQSPVLHSSKSVSNPLASTTTKPSPTVQSSKSSPVLQSSKAVATTPPATPNKQNSSLQSSKSIATSLANTSNKQSPALQSKSKSVIKATTNTTTPSKNTVAQTEPIRVNVQRTLCEQLKLRMAEQTDDDFPKLNDDEIDTFARNTEREMYLMFSKDTGVKYRAKYRSLMFNIKDRKNTSLFLKICDQSITAQQLVKMSADELASQELAQWRENENKHQLEMIKKSELDLLACSKTYVLKTHKGEEVMEGSTSDRVSLDPSVSVEDVVSILNNSTVSSTSENPDQHKSPLKDTRIDSRFERYHSGDLTTVAGSSKTMTGGNKFLISNTHETTTKSDRSSSKDKANNSQTDSKKTGSSQSDSKKTGSSSSGSKHRKRSRERSRERSRSDHHGSSDKKDDRNNRDRSHKSSSKHTSSDKDKDRKREDTKKHSTDKKSEKESPSTQSTVVENFSMIDKILEAQSTIDRILRPEEFAKKDAATNIAPKDLAVDDTKTITTNNIDLEPSSTVTIPTPPESLCQQNESPMDVDDDDSSSAPPLAIWTGSIFMVDVATFQISVSPVIGDCSSVSKEIPEELDVVGRISPDTVWEYIGKIKRSINKEILIIRFDSASPDDKEAYFTLYKYLYSRKRFGVIKTKSSLIKDFYIFPLASHKSMPSIVSNDDIEFDKNRTDLLLGIIVFNKNIPLAQPTAKKRPSASTSESSTAKLSRITEKKKTIVATVVAEEAKYTPPCSPKVVPAPVLRPTPAPFSKLLSSNLMDDGDEPYSPGGSDDDDDDNGVLPYASLMAQIPSAVSANPQLLALMSSASNSRDQPSPTTSLDQADLQRKMEELVRQIELQKQEIAMLGGEKTAAGGLSGIAIPPNLKEILNSIQGNVSAASGSTNYGIEEYDPMVQPSASAIAYQQLGVGYIPAVKDNAPSKLAQLTDEQLLNMVPDDIRNEILPTNRPPPTQLDPTVNMSKYNASQEPQPPGIDEEYVP